MKLLVVVDYQKDFVDGALGFPGAENLDEKIVNKIQEYMQDGCEIFYTMDTHTQDYLNTHKFVTLLLNNVLNISVFL